MSDPSSELHTTMGKLPIGEKGPVQDISRPSLRKTSATSSVTSAPKPTKKTKEPVADSWEDEADLSGDEPAAVPDLASPSLLSPTLSMEGPLDPPPTPISPQISQTWGGDGAASPAASGSARRPEKQTAVASRLIAGALGIRAPKRTEEERAYDRAIKEQEIKRRNREREEAAKAKEKEEKLKMSVWTD
ncbi:hypothetical protein N7493_003350 [Penicillium malachiteum]|uniref:Uncharacterized protein n=1 Tax=Penicillium malachiteum TaxID=1324776 RepID=A0AAD6MXP6_9EURO|nr:hypothetical protein N7493_003350 [Penicillium malachiteum]